MDSYNQSAPAPNPSSNKKIRAAVITIVICAVLAVAAIASLLFNADGNISFFSPTVNHGKTHYRDMKYEEPDTDKLFGDIDRLIGMINDEESFIDQSRLFREINDEVIDFKTMHALMGIRVSSGNCTDYDREQDEILSKAVVTYSDKIDKLFDTIALSTYKINYERTFFGINFFDDWEPKNYSETATALRLKETELTAEYTSMRRKANDELNEMLDTAATDEEINVAFETYYENSYIPFLELYTELVKTRLELAKELGTDYVDYAYGELERSYTKEEAATYMESVISEIVPLFSQYGIGDFPFTDIECDSMTSFYAFSDGAQAMGGEIAEAYDYMIKYGLYDFSYSESKVGVSYETFLDKYNAPYILSNPVGDISDFLTFSHEFGHFVDSYVTLDVGMTVDNAEIASQAMELILPLYSHGILDVGVEDLLRYDVYETLYTYASAALINDFETSVYALPLEEVTVENVESVLKASAAKVGMDEASVLKTIFQVQHIFKTPLYYVSYPVSLDVSLQVLEAELNDPGNGGIDSFMKVLDHDSSKTFVENLTGSGFKSPFEEGRCAKTAELMREVLEGRAFKSDSTAKGSSETAGSDGVAEVPAA